MHTQWLKELNVSKDDLPGDGEGAGSDLGFDKGVGTIVQLGAPE